MCAVSAIGDYARRGWEEDWTKKYPSLPDPFQQPSLPDFPTLSFPTLDTVTRGEFEALKAEVLRVKELLEAAAKFDAENNEPHCEVDDKVALLKKVAKLVGVDLSEIFEETKKPHVTIAEPIIEYTNKFIVRVRFMHGDADSYSTEDLFDYDAVDVFKNAHKLIDSVRFLHELEELYEDDYSKHPAFEEYGLDMPYDVHYGDADQLAYVSEVTVIYFDAEGVAFSVIVDGD